MTDFDDERWERERKARQSRQDRAQAMADVAARKVERVCKPGEWRVYRDGERIMVDLG